MSPTPMGRQRTHTSPRSNSVSFELALRMSLCLLPYACHLTLTIIAGRHSCSAHIVHKGIHPNILCALILSPVWVFHSQLQTRGWEDIARTFPLKAPDRRDMMPPVILRLQWRMCWRCTPVSPARCWTWIRNPQISARNRSIYRSMHPLASSGQHACQTLAQMHGREC